MQLVLLIIMVGIIFFVAETVTQLGPFYWKKQRFAGRAGQHVLGPFYWKKQRFAGQAGQHVLK